jgi:hypothetical protein
LLRRLPRRACSRGTTSRWPSLGEQRRVRPQPLPRGARAARRWGDDYWECEVLSHQRCRQVPFCGGPGDVRGEADVSEGVEVVLEGTASLRPGNECRVHRPRKTLLGGGAARRCASATLSNQALDRGLLRLARRGARGRRCLALRGGRRCVALQPQASTAAAGRALTRGSSVWRAPCLRAPPSGPRGESRSAAACLDHSSSGERSNS